MSKEIDLSSELFGWSLSVDYVTLTPIKERLTELNIIVDTNDHVKASIDLKVYDFLDKIFEHDREQLEEWIKDKFELQKSLENV